MIKFKDWVYLSEAMIAKVESKYIENGLNADDIDYAVECLDSWYENNPNMRNKRVNDGKTLVGWPLERAIERKRKMLSLERQKVFNNEKGKL